jgi:hypothetical protein
MTLIQPLLILAIVSAAAVHFRSGKQRLLSRIVTLLFVSMAVIFIVNPEATNRLAHAVGVGRGADLVLYTFFPASISGFLHLYRRSRQQDERLTQLVRHLAILEARRPGDPA